MLLLNIGLLGLLAAAAWWLTGLDKTAGGESKRTHYLFRIIRCTAIVWLAGGFLGTAVEGLEDKIETQPHDFELSLKLAEVHATHFGNFAHADKIIQQMEVGANFNPKQIALARAKLKEWREARPQRVT